MAGAAGEPCVIGVDFGTLSGRALVVRVRDGAELGSATHEYPHDVMDEVLAATGEVLPPDWALQDPRDYVDVLRHAVPAAIERAGIDPAQVIGIATDFTACTVLPVLRDGTPLCTLPDLAGRPHAYVKLWKHHAAQPHADRINDLAAERGEPWLARYGGKISSEWQFAKGLQLLEEDPEIYHRADRWIEAADWIIWQLCGTETRNACTAGYKGIYQDGHYPERDFLAALNPGFAGFADDKLAHPVAQLGTLAGRLTAEAAAWTGPARGHRRRRRQRGRARDPARRQRHRARPDGGHHGHLHLPRDERRRAGRGARHVRRGARRHRGRAVGLRGGPERGGRHLRLVRRARGAPRPTSRRPSGGASRCSPCCRRRRPRSPPGPTA